METSETVRGKRSSVAESRLGSLEVPDSMSYPSPSPPETAEAVPSFWIRDCTSRTRRLGPRATHNQSRMLVTIYLQTGGPLNELCQRRYLRDAAAPLYGEGEKQRTRPGPHTSSKGEDACKSNHVNQERKRREDHKHFFAETHLRIPDIIMQMVKEHIREFLGSDRGDSSTIGKDELHLAIILLLDHDDMLITMLMNRITLLENRLRSCNCRSRKQGASSRRMQESRMRLRRSPDLDRERHRPRNSPDDLGLDRHYDTEHSSPTSRPLGRRAERHDTSFPSPAPSRIDPME